MHITLATAAQAHLFETMAQQEGWGPGVGDADAFLATDPLGFHVGWIDDRPVATVSAVRFGDNFAFIGFYVVAPDLRGRGLGRRIWDAALETVAGRTLGLDGVRDQVGNYERAGFAFAHLTHRFSGNAEKARLRLSDRHDVDVQAVDATVPLAPDVLEYDTQHVPGARPNFIERWMTGYPQRRSFVARDAGAVTGIATVRLTKAGERAVGPLFADDFTTARALLSACLSDSGFEGARMRIDVPEVNSASVELVRELGLEPDFACARMYRGDATRLPMHQVFGNTTFELG